jgi:hypothetical protein
MKHKVLGTILIVVLSLIGIIAIAAAALVGLALVRPGMALSPVPADATAAVLTSRVSSQGISIPADAAAALLGSQLNAAGVQGLSIRSAGGTIKGNVVRLAVAGSYVLPDGTPVLGGKTVPVSVSAKMSLQPGDKPVIRLRGISVGRLPVPSFLLDRALAGMLAQAVLPDFVAADGRAYTLDLSKARIGGFALTSCRVVGERIVVGVALPTRAAEKALAYLGRTLARNRASIEEEARADSPAAPLMKDVAALAPLVSQARNEIAVTEFVEREPSVQYAESAAELVLSIGDALFAGAAVRTEAGEAAELRLADQSLIRLSESTRLSLSSIAQGGKVPSVLDLAAGAVRVKVAKLAGRAEYRVRTSSVSAGVRGTEFLIRVLPDGGAAIAVLEGTVEVAGSSGSVAVGEGEEASSTPDGRVQPAEPLTSESRRLLDAGSFVTPATVLNESFSPDALGMLWTILRQALAQWNVLPAEERARVQELYAGSFNAEELAATLGISTEELAKLGGG